MLIKGVYNVPITETMMKEGLRDETILLVTREYFDDREKSIKRLEKLEQRASDGWMVRYTVPELKTLGLCLTAFALTIMWLVSGG